MDIARTVGDHPVATGLAIGTAVGVAGGAGLALDGLAVPASRLLRRPEALGSVALIGLLGAGMGAAGGKLWDVTSQPQHEETWRYTRRGMITGAAVGATTVGAGLALVGARGGRERVAGAALGAFAGAVNGGLWVGLPVGGSIDFIRDKPITGATIVGGGAVALAGLGAGSTRFVRSGYTAAAAGGATLLTGAALSLAKVGPFGTN